MTDHLRELESGMSEIRALTPQLLSSLTGQDLARAHASLSYACAKGASSADEWSLALEHAFTCRTNAANDSPLYAWSLLQIAIVSENMGRLRNAEVFAKAFLGRVDEHTKLYVPWAYRVLARVAYLRGQFRRSVSYRLLALKLHVRNRQSEEADRTSISLAWSLGHMNRLAEAYAAIPVGVDDSLVPLVRAAEAFLALRSGHYQEAKANAAIAFLGKYESFDYVSAAEIASLLANAACVRGHFSTAQVYADKALSFASRQALDLKVLMALSLREMGGESPYDETSRGSADPRHGSCYTTGVG